jgi:hypothetical protein
MPAQSLIWRSYFEPVDEGRILAVQSRLGVTLPPSFIGCVRQSNGGQPEPYCFSYLDTDTKQIEEGSFGALLDFREPMDQYLKHIYRNDRDLWKDMDIEPWWTFEDLNIDERPDHFTPGLIAFSEDGGGNHLCFDYRAGKANPNPPVVFWHHEFHSGGEEPFFVAKDFDALLDLLRPCECDLAQLCA